MRKFAAVAFAIATSAAISATPARGAAHVVSATGAIILEATGSVKVSLREGMEFSPAAVGMELPAGASIKTGQRATATFSIPNGVVRVKPKSLIVIAELPGEGGATSVIMVKFGGVFVDTDDKAPGPKVVVKSATTVTTDRGGGSSAAGKDKKKDGK